MIPERLSKAQSHFSSKKPDVKLVQSDLRTSLTVLFIREEQENDRMA